MTEAQLKFPNGVSMVSRIKSLLIVSLLVLGGLAARPTEAVAQSDILLQLRSGSPAGDRFRIDSAGGVVALGNLGIGIIPASGCGYRMMWHPQKGAFRAGSTHDGGACPSWDEANVGYYSWAGGNLTRASGLASFAFGDGVTVTGQYGAAFGGNNTVSATGGFATGTGSNCTGLGCVAMGFTNTAGGQGAIAIGYRVTANANYSVAIGHRASANGHTGTFNIADASTTDSVLASANNQFNARYAGGYRLYSNSTKTTGVQVVAGANNWSAVSDRNLKTGFRSIDGEDMLRKIRQLPVSAWTYKHSEEVGRHYNVGPMAQDFQRIFQMTEDDKLINLSDLDGVTLAGVKALEERTTLMREELEAKDRTIRDLEARLSRLEALLRKK